MTGIPRSESGHFFNEKQKEVKEEIIQKLIDGFFDPFAREKDSFTELQHIFDLFTSILVMFNRELLSHLFLCAKITDDKDEIMKNLFNTIRKEVNRKMKEKS